MFEKSIIPFGLSMTCYQQMMTVSLGNIIRIFKRENNSNSWASFLNIYIYIENRESHTKLFDKQDNFGFDIVRMLFYCSNAPRKCSMGVWSSVS